MTFVFPFCFFPCVAAVAPVSPVFFLVFCVASGFLCFLHVFAECFVFLLLFVFPCFGVVCFWFFRLPCIQVFSMSLCFILLSYVCAYVALFVALLLHFCCTSIAFLLRFCCGDVVCLFDVAFILLFLCLGHATSCLLSAASPPNHAALQTAKCVGLP